MRKALEIFAPKSRTDALWKFVLFCVAINVWNIVWTWYVIGDGDRGLGDMILNGTFVGGPFAALFVTGSWHQFTAIQMMATRARFDALSGVLNRQTFVSRFQRLLPQTRRGLLLLIDADNFKSINDHHGHATGDKCIAAIGHRLNWHLREVDLVGRVGGEEFAVFLPDVTVEHGRTVAERLGQPVSYSDAAQGDHLTVTLSIGAVWTEPGIDADTQLALADDALYHAKTTGRARLVFSNGDPDILLGTASGPSAGPHAKQTERRRSQNLDVA